MIQLIIHKMKRPADWHVIEAFDHLQPCTASDPQTPERGDSRRWLRDHPWTGEFLPAASVRQAQVLPISGLTDDTSVLRDRHLDCVSLPASAHQWPGNSFILKLIKLPN